MFKEALQYLIGLGNSEIKYANGQTYSTQPVHLLKEPTRDAVEVRSLTGLVDYLKSKFDGEEKLMVHVVSPTEVAAFSMTNCDANREFYIKAKAMLPEFRYGNFHDPEEFIIKLQSVFVKNEDQAKLLKVVGNIKDEAVQSYGDDGVSQKVTAKTGVATVADVQVPNPVFLKPFRTFAEIDQPESEFVFRMRTGPAAAIFEADGGAWKLEAMQRVKKYLDEELKELVDAGDIVIIA